MTTGNATIPPARRCESCGVAFDPPSWTARRCPLCRASALIERRAKADAKYRASEGGRLARKRARQAYRASEKGKAAQRRWYERKKARESK